MVQVSHTNNIVINNNDKPVHVPILIYPSCLEIHLATLESVRPIIDTAIRDAHARYLQGWAPPNWLEIREFPMRECDDQKTAAWAALQALRWTSGSGVSLYLFIQVILIFSWTLHLDRLATIYWHQFHEF